jgi:hypothetical protein
MYPIIRFRSVTYTTRKYSYLASVPLTVIYSVMMTFVKFQEGQDTDLSTPISHSIVVGWVLLPDGERTPKSPACSD